jgi:excisionase family DNA binding protein
MTSLLNLSQVAERLGISRTSAWRLVATGDLPSIRVTETLRRVDADDLEAWISERREQRPAAKVVALRPEGSVPP